MLVLSNFIETSLKGNVRFVFIDDKRLESLLEVFECYPENFLSPSLWPCMLTHALVKSEDQEHVCPAFKISTPRANKSLEPIFATTVGIGATGFEISTGEIYLSPDLSHPDSVFVFSAQDSEEKEEGLVLVVKRKEQIEISLILTSQTSNFPLVTLTIPARLDAYKPEARWIQKISFGDPSVQGIDLQNSGLLLAAIPPQDEDELGGLVIYFTSNQKTLGGLVPKDEEVIR